MRAMTWISAVLVIATACKKGDDKKKAEPPPKIVEKQPEPPKAAAGLPVTSKSPEAIKAFEQGRDLVDNMRGPEASEHFKKAIELDPEFAQAHAYLGAMAPGAEGTDHLTKAGTLMAKVPEAEQHWITAAQAGRAGDPVKAKAALEKVLELAPGEWRADIILSNLARADGDTNGAIKRLEHALTIKPDLALAHNGIAYARAEQREFDQAIAAAKKQVELLPNQPNPRDTLAEMLLFAGKFEEAEKEFTAAVTMEPKFAVAWQGVGVARAYRGDYKGAYEAFDKRKASPAPGEKQEALLDSAWIAMAENKLPQALALLDEIEKDAAAKTLPVYAFTPLVRGHVYSHAGKYADAAKAYVAALPRAEALAGDAKAELMRGHRLGTLRIAALTGKPAADADKIVAAIEQDVKTTGDSTRRQSEVAYAKGLVAWAKKDVKGAITELSKCGREMLICRYDLATAQRKSGDKAAAEATEKEIKETPRRDAGAVYLISHLGKQ